MTRAGRGWRYLRQRGVMAFIRAVNSRFIYRSSRFVVTRAVLAGPPAADHVGDIVFRLATASDLDGLDELESYGRGPRHRFYVREDNDWLFVACHRDRIVATRRYSRALPQASRDGLGLMSRVVELEPGQIWAADTFCLPEYRGQGIAGFLGLFAKRFLASFGYRENLSAIAFSNRSALRMAHHAQSERVCYVTYVRLLGYERLRVSKDMPRQLRGIFQMPRRRPRVGPSSGQ